VMIGGKGSWIYGAEEKPNTLRHDAVAVITEKNRHVFPPSRLL
jgi:hypothetical protein